MIPSKSGADAKHYSHRTMNWNASFHSKLTVEGSITIAKTYFTNDSKKMQESPVMTYAQQKK